MWVSNEINSSWVVGGNTYLVVVSSLTRTDSSLLSGGSSDGGDSGESRDSESGELHFCVCVESGGLGKCV